MQLMALCVTLAAVLPLRYGQRPVAVADAKHRRHAIRRQRLPAGRRQSLPDPDDFPGHSDGRQIQGYRRRCGGFGARNSTRTGRVAAGDRHVQDRSSPQGENNWRLRSAQGSGGNDPASRLRHLYWHAASAPAADGILLPSPPVGPGGEDAITTSEGVRCSQSINSSGGYLDFGVAGGDLSNYASPSSARRANSAIGYARIIMPLGVSPKRLDCSELYDLEIQRLKAEIEMLRVGLE